MPNKDRYNKVKLFLSRHKFLSVKFNTFTPKIWLFILLSSCCCCKKSNYQNLVLNQDNEFYLISLSTLITRLLENVWLLYGEVTCSSLVGVKGCLQDACCT